MNKNDPAFPIQTSHNTDRNVADFGLTKREWFAGMAMQGMCARADAPPNIESIKLVAYGIADAMLEES